MTYKESLRLFSSELVWLTLHTDLVSLIASPTCDVSRVRRPTMTSIGCGGVGATAVPLVNQTLIRMYWLVRGRLEGGQYLCGKAFELFQHHRLRDSNGQTHHNALEPRIALFQLLEMLDKVVR
jgi:hypothetical protein